MLKSQEAVLLTINNKKVFLKTFLILSTSLLTKQIV